jgi:hypothetical protein
MSDQRGTGPADDETVAEPFDQTNGQVGGLDGDSDGTAESDTGSEADREDDDGVRGVDGLGAIDGGFIIGRQQ